MNMTMVQFYFYPRQDELPFEMRPTIIFDSLITGGEIPLYVGFIDWGDGEQEYWDKPQAIYKDTVIKHNYAEAGIYSVTGYMFEIIKGYEEEFNTPISRGVREFKHFTTRFKLNRSVSESGFGEDRYTYIPYEQPAPVVSGISTYSNYYKTIKRQLGLISDTTELRSMKIPAIFNNEWLQMEAEGALVAMDTKFTGDMINGFTGSYAYPNNFFTRPDNIIYDEFGGNAIGTADQTFGIFQRSKYGLDGKRIGFGEFNNNGELGDYLGKVDLGQIRYFKSPYNMYEMLGFKDEDQDDANHPGNPGSPRYWKNIIPSSYEIDNPNSWGGLVVCNDYGDPSGECLHEGQIIGQDQSQEWIGTYNFDGNSYPYYYPVLPKVSKYGNYDLEGLGYQGSIEFNDGLGKIPFGSVDRKWNEDDGRAIVTKNPPSTIYYRLGDFNQDGVVDSTDYAFMVAHFYGMESWDELVDFWYNSENPVFDDLGDLPTIQSELIFPLSINQLSSLQQKILDLDLDEVISETDINLLYNYLVNGTNNNNINVDIPMETMSTDLIIDLDLSKVDINVLHDDAEESNMGLVTGDFRVEYDSNTTKPKRTQNLDKPKAKKSRKRSAY